LGGFFAGNGSLLLKISGMIAHRLLNYALFEKTRSVALSGLLSVAAGYPEFRWRYTPGFITSHLRCLGGARLRLQKKSAGSVLSRIPHRESPIPHPASSG